MFTLTLAIGPVRTEILQRIWINTFHVFKSKPFQIGELQAQTLFRRTLFVGVLDTQNKLALIMLSEQFAKQRRARATDVQIARGAWCKPCPWNLRDKLVSF